MLKGNGNKHIAPPEIFEVRFMQTADASNFFRTEAELVKDEARKEKAERTKDSGAPLDLAGKVLSLRIRGSDAWTAESGHVVRRLSLESGKTLQLYKGHTGPVTCLAFHEPDTLFTGSWDRTIKAWKIADSSLLASTSAHSDFVKALLVIPSLSLLVSGSSDKVVRFWDLFGHSQLLSQLGSLPAHVRPVEAFAFDPSFGTLYTADTMGVIKAWQLQREYGASSRCRGTLKVELQSHRTGVRDLWVGKGFVWSASSDESVLIQPVPVPISSSIKKLPKAHSIAHPHAVKAILPLALTQLEEPCQSYLISACGDMIRTYAYDISTSDDPPELLSEIDAHWHDVTALGLWVRVVEQDGNKQPEIWILSASLDATLRRWRLTDLINPKSKQKPESTPNPFKSPPKSKSKSTLTEDEERELAELMDVE